MKRSLYLPVDQHHVKVQWENKHAPYFQLIKTRNVGAYINPSPLICKGAYQRASETTASVTSKDVFPKVASIFSNTLRQEINLSRYRI